MNVSVEYSTSPPVPPIISRLHCEISLNIGAPSIIYMPVRRFQSIVFVLAALLWLPVSAHCQLEAIPGFEFLRCSVSTADTHQSAKDCSDCCALEKSQYKTEHFRLTIPTPDFLPVFSAPELPVSTALPVEVSLGILTAAPPQWLKTWQFVSRTALPIRAPSLAS